MQPLPEKGRKVENHISYWIRRIEDGDVVQFKPEDPKKKAAPEKSATPVKTLSTATTSQQTNQQGDKT